jgi:O-antigen ligase
VTDPPDRLARATVAAAAVGAAGLALAGLTPAPFPLVGYGIYAGAIGFARWIAIPLIILTLPFSARPAPIGPLEFAVAEVATLLAAGVFAISARRRWLPGGTSLNNSPRNGRSDAGVWFAAAFLAAGCLSLLVSEYPKQSLRELRWVIVEPVLFFLIAHAALTTQMRISVTLWAVVAAGVVAALAAIVFAGAVGELMTFATRPAFPYQSPNHLALFLGRAAAVALALAMFGPARLRAGAALLPIGLALVRSISLGAWLGIASAAITLAALRGRRLFLATSMLLVVMVAALAIALPRERTLGRFDPSSGTGLFRIQIWESSLRMIADQPILGVGLDNFLYQYRRGYMLPEAWEEPNISHPHNWALHFWLALGLPGLAVALGMIWWLADRARGLLARPVSPLDPTIGAAALGTLVATLVHGSFDNSYFLFDMAMLWWLVAALVSVGGGVPTEQSAIDSSRKIGAELPS